MVIYETAVSSHFLVDIHPFYPEIPGTFSLPFLFYFSLLRSPMASRTRSQTADSVPTFEDQRLFKEPEKEVCSFDNADITAIRASGAFPVDAIIRPFDREVRLDASSNKWVCFLSYPFSIGL
ncbi:hypothetical protein Hanom_Chr03g00185581 [Helianthus anomalus]